MSLPTLLEQRLRLPLVAAPMFLVSNPALVSACCNSGIVGSFPALNLRESSGFSAWLDEISASLQPDAAPFAVNLIVHQSNPRLQADLAICVERRVPIVITSLGAVKEVVDAVHGYGGLVFHDVTTRRHAEKAAEAGVDGLIVVDLPPEEDDELCEPATAAGLDFIRLVTPTSDAERLPVVLGSASGFVYYVAITGITGTRSAAADSISAAYKRISAATDLPVVTGFGIRTPEQAGEAASLSDGAIVGSAVVEIIAGNLGDDGKGTPEIVSKIAAFVGDLAMGVAGKSG